ncbi:MAG TPA: thioesterase family protein [Actinomycetes bacterium]|nr:thioesterase family protein [Actinomycetes bacterium]
MSTSEDGTQNMTFEDATALMPVEEGTFGWEVPDGWQQGRGAWGGLVAGGLARAVLIRAADPVRRLRTMSVHMCAPLRVGPATVRVDALRVGSGMSTWAAEVRDSDGLVAHAVVITGRPRAADLVQLPTWGDAPAPTLPHWLDVDVLGTDGPGWPPFMGHVEFRVCAGLPLTGSPARCAGYVGFRDGSTWDAERLVAIIDAWYPTALAALAESRPLATVSYAAHLLLAPEHVETGKPLVFESTMSAANDGYTTETRRLWTHDGRLVVENHQSVAVIR